MIEKMTVSIKRCDIKKTHDSSAIQEIEEQNGDSLSLFLFPMVQIFHQMIVTSEIKTKHD